MSVSDVKEDNKLMPGKNPVNIAFVANGVKNLSESGVLHDSTFALMLAAQELNIKVLYTESNNLKIVNNKVFAKFDEVKLKQKAGEHLNVVATSEYSLDSMDIVFARKDPPVNQEFLSYLLMLSMIPTFKTLIINSPLGMLKANEKLYALNFPDLIPQTLVSSQAEEIKDFLNDNNEAVLKSLFYMGGREVFYLNKNVQESFSTIESSLRNESPLIVQKFIPEVKNGDKRIILLNGTPIGALARIPKAGEFRTNMNQGASIKPANLSKKDLEICEELKPHLQKDGLYFTGIDVIGDYLIEVNVTSPTCLQEIERFTGRQLAKEIVMWAVERASCERKGNSI